MAHILDDLTAAQREAVTHIDGPMLVVAGAGSGKTRVVTRRIAHLISRGIWPGQILAMTFTNKAAKEMKERVAALAGEEPRWVGTFHSACARFLRQDIERLGDGRTSEFTIYDTADQDSVIKLCLRDLDISDKERKPAWFRAELSRAKSRALGPDDIPLAGAKKERQTVAVYRAYEARMRELNALDFDDLLLLTVRLFEQRPDVLDRYHSRFRYILVDEYQDTNRLQYHLMRHLAGPAENVHVTGDPDQSIYSWRGAEYRNIMDFSNDFPAAKVVRLEQNYRSTKCILHAANNLIKANTQRIEKDLFTENDEGTPLSVVAVANDRDEASAVLDRIVTLQLDGCAFSDMAVFYRTNAQSRPFEEALTRAGIQYQILGGLRFYERREVKDILAHLRLLVNPRDAVSLQRVIGCRPTGVGDATLRQLLADSSRLGKAPLELLADPQFPSLYSGRLSRRLKDFNAWCQQFVSIPQTPVGDAIHQVITHSGLIERLLEQAEKDPLARERIENLSALVDQGYEHERLRPDTDLAAFLEEVALVADVDSHEPDQNSVTLMTLHSSKGLEFDMVFIVGAEEGYLPLRSSMENRDSVEEERRLFYVGITRARQQVMISHSLTRYVWGALEVRQPSRFLDELPEDGVLRLQHR